MNALERLKKKEEQIKALQEKKSRLEGKKEQLLSDLKEKFDVTTLKEGQKLQKEKKAQLEVIEKNMVDLLEEMDKIVEGATCET